MRSRSNILWGAVLLKYSQRKKYRKQKTEEEQRRGYVENDEKQTRETVKLEEEHKKIGKANNGNGTTKPWVEFCGLCLCFMEQQGGW